MIPPGRGGLAGGTVIPSGNPLGVLRRDHHAVKRRVIASSLREGKPWLIKTRAEDALQPWSADRLREGNSDKKTNAEAGCTEPMAHNGSATQTTSHEWKILNLRVTGRGDCLSSLVSSLHHWLAKLPVASCKHAKDSRVCQSLPASI